MGFTEGNQTLTVEQFECLTGSSNELGTSSKDKAVLRLSAIVVVDLPGMQQYVGFFQVFTEQ